MSIARKISARKIVQVLLTVVLAGVCVAAIMSATQTQKAKTLSGVNIRINNSQYGFVNEAQIKQMLLRDGMVRLNSTKLSDINVKQMERVVTESPWVEEAQVYIDNQHVLHALVTQRVPKVRIFEKNGNSYYLDKKMQPMPLSAQYNYYTTVVTNVPELKNDSAAKVLRSKIAVMADYIRRDTFWNAQVSQLVVRDDMMFEIVPVLGEQQVIFGDTTNMKKKFDNLFAFYTKVLNEVGWDKYQVLDLSYNGQLVASPALNWKMPVDKVINNINWVNSILNDDKSVSAAITAKPVKLAALNAPAEASPAKKVVKEKVVEVVAVPVVKEKEVTAKKTATSEVKKVAAPAKTATETVVKKQEPKPVKKAEATPAKNNATTVAKKPEPKPAKATATKTVEHVAAKPPVKKVKKEVKKLAPEKKKEVKKHATEPKQEDKKPKYIYNG